METPLDLHNPQDRPGIAPVGASAPEAVREHAEVERQTIGFEEFAPEAASVADVRRFVRRTLDAVGIPDDRTFECQLVADELATNAVRHAGTMFSVALELTDAFVRIAVRDGSSVQPVCRQPGVEAMRGRGLTIVAGASTSWGTVPLGVGKEIWADVMAPVVDAP